MTKTTKQRDFGFWTLLIPGWLLFLYLVYAQAIPAFNYELGVAMGTQESATQITAVGAAFWYGFAFGDLLIYLPLLALGLTGVHAGKSWGKVVMGAALGITVYWPVVCLSAVVAARGSTGWNLSNESDYWLVLPLVSAWGLWGLWQISRQQP